MCPRRPYSSARAAQHSETFLLFLSCVLGGEFARGIASCEIHLVQSAIAAVHLVGFVHAGVTGHMPAAT